MKRPLPVPLQPGRAPTWRAREIVEYQRRVDEARAAIGDGGPGTSEIAELELIVVGLLESLAEAREILDKLDKKGELRRAYERFSAALETVGVPMAFQTRSERAFGHRRLGEIAERRGDVFCALWHYDQALRCRESVGVKRRRDQLAREASPASFATAVPRRRSKRPTPISQLKLNVT